MKKGSVIFTVAFAMICMSVFGIFEFVNADNTSGEKLAESTGENLREGAEMLLDGGVSTHTVDDDKIGEGQKMIMNINGIDISEGFYKYKLGLMVQASLSLNIGILYKLSMKHICTCWCKGIRLLQKKIIWMSLNGKIQM